jgi:hypothetical protein
MSHHKSRHDRKHNSSYQSPVRTYEENDEDYLGYETPKSESSMSRPSYQQNRTGRNRNPRQADFGTSDFSYNDQRNFQDQNRYNSYAYDQFRGEEDREGSYRAGSDSQYQIHREGRRPYSQYGNQNNQAMNSQHGSQFGNSSYSQDYEVSKKR